MLLSALRLNRIFRLATYVALLAMLLPVILPFFHHQAPVRFASSHPICHIALNGSAQQLPAQQKSKPACPICQSLSQMAQGFVTPTASALIVIPAQNPGLVFYAEAGFVFEPHTLAWPRAPPVLA